MSERDETYQQRATRRKERIYAKGEGGGSVEGVVFDMTDCEGWNVE